MRPVLLASIFVVLAAAAAAVWAFMGFGQPERGPQEMIVHDPMGRPIAGARLALLQGEGDRPDAVLGVVLSDAAGRVRIPAESAYEWWRLTYPGCLPRLGSRGDFPAVLPLEPGFGLRLKVGYPIDLRARQLRWTLSLVPAGASPSRPVFATRASLLGPIEGGRPAPELQVDAGTGEAACWVSRPGTYSVTLGLAPVAGGAPALVSTQPIEVEEGPGDTTVRLEVRPADVTRAVREIEARN